MASLAEIRAQYPQYSDMPDRQLADKIHGKFYSDMSRAEFYKRIGFSPIAADQQRMHAPFLAEPPGLLSRVGSELAERGQQALTGATQGVGDIAALFAGPFERQRGNLDLVRQISGLPPAPPQRTQEEISSTLMGTVGLQPMAATDPAGEYLQRGIRNLTAALPLPLGGLAARGAIGAISGVGGEGAVDLTGTGGTPVEPLARLAGELTGGVGGGFAAGLRRSTPQQLLREATEGLSEQQLAAAQRLMDDATARGAPITAAEAIAQVTGRNTDLLAMQRVAEQSRLGSRVLDPMMAGRPAANTAAFDTAVSNVVPTPSAQPATIAPRMAQAADAVVGDAAAARSRMIRKYYTSASPGIFPPERVKSVVDDINAALDKTIGGVGPESAAGKQLVKYRDELLSLADDSGLYHIGTLDNLYKTYRDRLLSSPMENPEAISKTVGALIGRINDKLGGLLTAESPELAAGRQIYKNVTEAVVDPLKQGPVGRLAEAVTFDKVRNVLMPASPDDLTAAGIRTSITQISAKDPGLLPEFLRRNLEAVWASSAKDLQAGPSQWGGANFVKAVTGNREQREILKALIEALPGGQTKWVGFRNFLDILAAQGKRQFPGSMTEFNRQMGADLRYNTTQALARPLGVVNQFIEQYTYGRNTANLARILADPKGVELISKLAYTKPTSARGATLAAELLALSRAGQTRPTPPQ